MRMRSIAGGLAAVCVLSTAANAAVFTTTYEGTIDLDPRTDVFGVLSAFSLPFTAVFVTDTALGGRVTTGSSDHVGAFAPDHPLLSAKLTINGVTYNFTDVGLATAEVEAGQYAYNHLSYQETDGLGLDTDNVLFLSAVSALLPGSLDTPFDVASTGAYIAPSLQISVFDNDAQTQVAFASGGFNVARVHSTGTTTAVPEPSTWALMILGFTGAGAALRRSRTEVQAV